ncbi:MAG: PilZ domain-containing protein [Planctomycetota bacterium]
MAGLKAVVAQVLEAGRIRERLLSEQARQISHVAGLLLETARTQRTLHVLGEGPMAPLAEFLAARFRGDGDSLLLPARELPPEVDARALLAFAHPEEALLVLSADPASRLAPLLRQAASQGVSVAALLGRQAAPLASYCAAAVIIPPADLRVAGELILSLGHVLCGLVGQGLGTLRPVPQPEEAPAPQRPPSRSFGREPALRPLSGEQERPAPHRDAFHKDSAEYEHLGLQPDSDEGRLLGDAVEAGYAPPTDPHGRARSRPPAEHGAGPGPASEPEPAPEGAEPRFRFRCGGCEAVISVDPRHCGRRGKCPHCQAEFTIPNPRGSSESRPRLEAEPASPRGAEGGDSRQTSRRKTSRRRRSATTRERRRAPRVEVIDALVRLATEGYPDARPGYHEPHSLDDLSLTGLRFLGPQRRYEIGEAVYLSLDFPAFPLPVRVKGEIRRVVRLENGDGFGTGVRFTEYVGDAEGQIRRLLETDQLRAVRRR